MESTNYLDRRRIEAGRFRFLPPSLSLSLSRIARLEGEEGSEKTLVGLRPFHIRVSTLRHPLSFASRAKLRDANTSTEYRGNPFRRLISFSSTDNPRVGDLSRPDRY